MHSTPHSHNIGSFMKQSEGPSRWGRTWHGELDESQPGFSTMFVR